MFNRMTGKKSGDFLPYFNGNKPHYECEYVKIYKMIVLNCKIVKRKRKSF